MAASLVVKLNPADFEQQISQGCTLVDFPAEYCAPCQALLPFLEQLAISYRGRLKVATYLIDQDPAIPVRYGVRGAPTFILFQNGQPVDLLVGNAPQKIGRLVERNLGA